MPPRKHHARSGQSSRPVDHTPIRPNGHVRLFGGGSPPLPLTNPIAWATVRAAFSCFSPLLRGGMRTMWVFVQRMSALRFGLGLCLIAFLLAVPLAARAEGEDPAAIERITNLNKKALD